VVYLSGSGMRPEGSGPLWSLYGPGRYFLYRHCYDLSYQSQRDNVMYRALHKAQSIRERLGGSANMTEPFPEKPKGMHWRTYERLWREHYEAGRFR
jgi:hypothetical protein